MKALLACVFACCGWFQDDSIENRSTENGLMVEQELNELPRRKSSGGTSEIDEFDWQDLDLATFKESIYSDSDDLSINNLTVFDIQRDLHLILNGRYYPLSFGVKMKLTQYLMHNVMEPQLRQDMWLQFARDCAFPQETIHAVTTLLQYPAQGMSFSTSYCGGKIFNREGLRVVNADQQGDRSY